MGHPKRLPDAGGISAKGILLWAMLLVLFGPGSVLAKEGRAETCMDAAQVAHHETGVPLDVLRSIALLATRSTDTGAPDGWPWTVSVDGSQHRFTNQADAGAFLQTVLLGDGEDVKVGCFQIDMHRHGAAFATPATALEPEKNAIYAARWLRELFREKGEWGLAAGALHSRSVREARAFETAFRALQAGTAEPDVPSSAPAGIALGSLLATGPSSDPFDMVMQTRSRATGSLVPLTGMTHTAATLLPGS